MSFLEKQFERARGKAQHAAQQYGFAHPGSQQQQGYPEQGYQQGYDAPPPQAHQGSSPGQAAYNYGQVPGQNPTPDTHGAPGAPPPPPRPHQQHAQHGALGSLAAGTYTTNFPHLIRQGLAQFDPRLNLNRPFFLYNSALKGVDIDFEALFRECHSQAKASFEYGQEHIAQNRFDGIGDEVLVDILDRLAFTSALQGDLYQAHVKKLEDARKAQKHSLGSKPLESAEVLQARQRRAQLARHLSELGPEAASRPNSPQAQKSKEVKAELDKLENEGKSTEVSVAYGKRDVLKTNWLAQSDALIELSEKLALLGRYQKLLVEQIPVGAEGEKKDPITFPADRTPKDRTRQPAWSGAVRVAEIRSAVKSALEHLQVDTTLLPHVPEGCLSVDVGGTSGASAPLAAPSVTAPAASTNDTAALSNPQSASFGITHAAELSGAGAGAVAGAGATAEVGTTQQGSQAPPTQPTGNPGYPSAAVPASGQPAESELAHKLNLAPTNVPTSPAGGQASHVPPTTTPPSSEQVTYAAPTSATPPGPSAPTSGPIPAPDQPTVAETGAPIVGANGPASGSLGHPTPNHPAQTNALGSKAPGGYGSAGYGSRPTLTAQGLTAESGPASAPQDPEALRRQAAVDAKERERQQDAAVATAQAQNPGSSSGAGDDSAPPPYSA